MGSSLHLLVALDHVNRWQRNLPLHSLQQVSAEGTSSMTPSIMAVPEYLTLTSRAQMGSSGGGGGLRETLQRFASESLHIK
jgi:hypothetical protein